MTRFTIPAKETQEKRPQALALKWELPLAAYAQIYPRVSTPDQKYNISALMQQDRNFALLCGWLIDKLIVEADDLGLSGQLRMEERPAFIKMLRNIASGKVKAIIVANVDRFFRRKWMDEAEKFMQICEHYGVKIIIPNATRTDIEFVYDFSKSSHVQQFRQKCIESWNYLENHIYGRVLPSKDELSRMGRWTGFGLTLGFLPDRRAKIDGIPNQNYLLYTPYEPHIKVANWHFDRFIALGCNLMELSREVERMEYTFPAFEEWVDREIVAQVHQHKVFDENGKLIGYKIKSVAGLRNYFLNVRLIGYWVYKGELLSTENHQPIIDIEKFTYVYNKLSLVRLDGTENEEVIERKNRYMKRHYTDYEAILQGFTEAYDPAMRVNVCTNPVQVEGVKTDRAARYYGFFKRNNDHKTAKYMLLCADVDRIFLQHFINRLQKADEFANFLSAEGAEKEEQAQLEQDIVLQITATKSRMAKIEAQAETGELTNPKLAKKANAKYNLLEKELQRLENSLEKFIKTGTKARRRRTYKQLMYEVGDALNEETIDELIPPEEMPQFIDTFVEKVVFEPRTTHFYMLYIHWCDPEWGIDELLCYRAGNPSSKWTDQELLLLRQHFPSTPREEMMQILPKRSCRAMADMAKKRGFPAAGMYKTHPVLPYEHCWEDWQVMQEYALTESDVDSLKRGTMIAVSWSRPETDNHHSDGGSFDVSASSQNGLLRD
jgi:predicted site-specific integrase-resolvase